MAHRLHTAIFFFLLALSLSGHCQATKNIVQQSLLWYVYNNTIAFDKHWAVVTDVQERHYINPTAQHQLVFRTHLRRNIGNNWNVGAGMTWFFQYPNDPTATNRLAVPELRPHLELGYQQKLGFGRLSHRYRGEARFFHNTDNGKLSDGYDFGNFRFRYQISWDMPLLKSKKDQHELLTFKVYDEIHLNAGGNIVQNTFDQNRIYIGFLYTVVPAVGIELGYLNWFQQRSTGVDFYNRHIVRLAIQHKVNLHKK